MAFCLITIADERTAPDLESEIQRAVRERPRVQPIESISELAPALDDLEQEWIQISGPSTRYVGDGLERTNHVLAQSGLSEVADALFHHTSMVLATGLEAGQGRTLRQWSPNHWIQLPEPRHLLVPSRVRPAGVLFRREWLIEHIDDLSLPATDCAQLVHRGVIQAGNAARLLVLPWILAEEVINLPDTAADLLETMDFDLVPQLLMGITWKHTWHDPSPALLELMVENARPTEPTKPVATEKRLQSMAQRLLRLGR